MLIFVDFSVLVGTAVLFWYGAMFGFCCLCGLPTGRSPRGAMFWFKASTGTTSTSRSISSSGATRIEHQ
jgi:hypothetical protein